MRVPSSHLGEPQDAVQLSCLYSSSLQFVVLTSTVLYSLYFVEKQSVALVFYVLYRVLVSTGMSGILTVGSTEEAMQDLLFNSFVPNLSACLVHVNLCLLSLSVYLPYTSCPAIHSSISASLCVMYETAAVLVATQQGFLNHMQRGMGEDVSDLDVLKAVEAGIRESTVVKRIGIYGEYLRWTNVATAILKGAAQSKTLSELQLETPEYFPPPQEVVDNVRRANPKLRLIVTAGSESASHDITWHHMPLVHCPTCCLSDLPSCVWVVWGGLLPQVCHSEVLWATAALEGGCPAPSLQRGLPSVYTHGVVPVWGSADWPRTLLFTHGEEGLVLCILLTLCIDMLVWASIVIDAYITRWTWRPEHAGFTHAYHHRMHICTNCMPLRM